MTAMHKGSDWMTLQAAANRCYLKSETSTFLQFLFEELLDGDTV